MSDAVRVFQSRLDAAASDPAAAALLGRMIGLDGAAPLATAARARRDPDYARALFTVRMIPEVRDRLIEAAEQEDEPSPGVAAEAPPLPAGVLAGKLAKAVLKWGMEGLEHAEPWIIQRRLAACNACPFQMPAPDTLVYRGVKVLGGDSGKICNRCQCLTNTKAALASERCPERSKENPALSRWSEPWEEVGAKLGWPWA